MTARVTGFAIVLCLWAAAAQGAQVQPAKRAACIWANTSANSRAAMLARAPDLDAILGPITDEQAEGLVAKCGMPASKASMVTVGQVLRAQTLMAWSLDELMKYKVSQSMLDAQWPGLASATKQDFTRSFTPAFMPSDAAYKGLDALQAQLNLTGDEAGNALLLYVQARAVLEGVDGI